MLTIRSAQLSAFRESALAEFEASMLVHLRALSPRLRETPGDEALGRMIHDGIRHARAYGFTLRGPVRLFLELKMLFGSQFHNDPQYQWAITTLAERSQDPETLVARRLYERARDYQSRVFGPRHAYLNRALHRIQYLAQPNAIATDALASRTIEVIRRVYPEKADDVGEQRLRALLARGVKDAGRYRLPEVRGAVLLTCLQLVFGHGSADDPLHPWIGETLRNAGPATDDARLRRLEQATSRSLQEQTAQGDVQA